MFLRSDPTTTQLPSQPSPALFPRTAALSPDPRVGQIARAPASLLTSVLLRDVGYSKGFRLSNLGGRREIFIPVPQGVDLNVATLSLSFDDLSAHEARRSLEVLVNDRSVSSLVLDGKGNGRTLRIPLANVSARDGFVKLSFLYSGAATQDRCIDVRYVGDSLTVLPDSALEFEIGVAGVQTIAATAALMPHDVAILLSASQISPEDISTALTLARSLTATGRRVTFHHGTDALPALVRLDEDRRWTQGLIVVGAMERVANRLDAPLPMVASAGSNRPIPANDNSLAAARIGGVPVLLVTDAASARAGRLLGNPSLAVLRDTRAASIGPAVAAKGRADRITFDELGLAPAQAEVFGRADLTTTIPNRALPGGTRASRMMLDLMVAPDGAGEKAVVSVFLNERLLASTVAAIGEPTRLDFAIPDGLIGAVANIRTVVQRRSAQGDCRFEPQGYPVEMLGTSSLVLSSAGANAQSFSDLATLWGGGTEIFLPWSTSTRPLALMGFLSEVLNGLSSEAAPVTVRFITPGAIPTPGLPFIVVGNVAPAGATPNVRFDRGRVAITDRAGLTRLDVGGLDSGAVAQIVSSGSYSGLWIKPLAADGSLPVTSAVLLDHGDVAFLDKTGVALALSTERDTLLRVSYPDRQSWLDLVGRYQSWILGAIWMLLTLVVLFLAQRAYRRRAAAAGE